MKIAIGTGFKILLSVLADKNKAIDVAKFEIPEWNSQ